jgi:energy-converting hydrogenase Eha subunit C
MNTEKAQTLAEHMTEVLGGTPVAVALKAVIGGLAILWSHLDNVGTVVMLYAILVVVDVILGTAQAKAKQIQLHPTRWLSGPAKKLGLTAVLFLGASVIDSIIPGEFVLFGMSGYVAGALFLDVAKKYDAVTGMSVFAWLEDKLGSLVRRKEQE